GDLIVLPFDDWINAFVRGWLVPNFRPVFRAAQVPITLVLNNFEAFFLALPWIVTTAGFSVAAWKWAGRSIAIFTILGFAFIDMIGLWPQTMTTLAMVVTSVLFCATLGIPAGILAAR